MVWYGEGEDRGREIGNRGREKLLDIGTADSGEERQ